MVFSSTLFLFMFLPLVLISYMAAGRGLRNLILLTASLIFYIWGETIYVVVMLVSIGMNYLFGRWIDRSINLGNGGKPPLIVAITANIGMLMVFKYTNFAIENLNIVLNSFGLQQIMINKIHLPIGISFFTFQAMSYIIDVFRQQAHVQKNPLKLGLYISLFPQLIAGPIVRYNSIEKQIDQRNTSLIDFRAGTERFIYGLGKKVLIANPLAIMADLIFSLPTDQLSTVAAWLGIICYTLQIYFDFSGYSDMAIGLGRIVGFTFPENFNYPYISRSIREFWRRWHMTLSSWFRDYLYIPLGGNKKSHVRTRFNLLTVFLLTGLWHGASWNFIIWGLLHGFFLLVERGVTGRLISAFPGYLQNLYMLFVVVNAWVFFRIDELSQSINYLTILYGRQSHIAIHPYIIQNINGEFFVTLVTGIVLSTPLFPFVKGRLLKYCQDSDKSYIAVYPLFTMRLVTVTMILLFSLSSIAMGSYNPFIYFRF